MENNIKLLSSELQNISAYMDRLFLALIETTALYHRPLVHEMSDSLNKDLIEHISRTLLQEGLFNEKAPSDPKSVQARLKGVILLANSFVQINSDPEVLMGPMVEMINLLYDHAQGLHQYIDDNSPFEISYPHIGLLQVSQAEEWDHDTGESLPSSSKVYEEDDFDTFTIPRFFLPLSSLDEANASDRASISSLDSKRSQTLEIYIEKGHQAAQENHFTEALTYFQKALSLKVEARTLTLVGWANSLLLKWEVAKSFCLKAIRQDPDYGPAYNDLGTYLLSQGQILESIKWFNLAKKALKFENREFPYINTGRALMMQKKYKAALSEFNKALKMAPFHKELNKTVERLKTSLNKNIIKEIKSNHTDSELPPSVF